MMLTMFSAQGWTAEPLLEVMTPSAGSRHGPLEKRLRGQRRSRKRRQTWGHEPKSRCDPADRVMTSTSGSATKSAAGNIVKFPAMSAEVSGPDPDARSLRGLWTIPVTKRSPHERPRDTHSAQRVATELTLGALVGPKRSGLSRGQTCGQAPKTRRARRVSRRGEAFLAPAC